MSLLADKVAIITGAGISRATAVSLAACGCKAALVSRREDRCHGVGRFDPGRRNLRRHEMRHLTA
jgi:NADP-dependent 3-hydroxy acid dehydrogenase YdfG